MMAEASICVAHDHFICPVCLDLLKDPVTTPCGHSYCGDCIEDYWVQADNAGVYRCPQCRQTFTPRPVLGRNTMLAEVLEKVKKAEVQAAPPDRCYAGPGDAECDVCIGRKKKAVKSCLVCLASYCETHLQPHYESPTFKKHKLIDATGQLQDKICSLHEKLLEIYCRTDHQCICRVCVMDEHRTHDTVLVDIGSIEKQKHPEVTRMKFQRRVEEGEPRTRAQFLQYACQLTLDPNTAHKELCLSEGNTVVKRGSQPQGYPSHPHRFNAWHQVLCKEPLSGRCYWEVQWSGSYSFKHNNEETAVPITCSTTIGVYLDHSAGTLSFYSVFEDTMTLLHRVQTTFTEPLYPGFWMQGSRLNEECTIKLCTST
ncbi:E3 ubiquitin/ISG15 ligase TRIM25-like isoform X2 [Scleropages formosus]|uniref:E3 ubiquitin/ISG15 ligase TRIM25-like isoform X2 n=1 Tax=Scleropages formosus TaxID=113540 RepID=UPI00087815A8|nr:E3 ubiquitin/ISG15 ligase TRIM25-like isoform X2 [Scleropages formosus]